MAAALMLAALLPGSVLMDNADLRRVPNDVLYDPIDFTYGLQPLETLGDGTTYNRTGGQAFFTYPYRANMGRKVHVSARLAADPAGAVGPMSATLILNGKPEAHFDALPNFSVFDATVDARDIPNPYLDPAHLQLEIRSDTHLDGAGKNAGVAIDWISVESRRDPDEIWDEAVLWGVTLALFILLAVSRLGLLRAALAGLCLLATMILVRMTYVPRALPPWAEIALVGVSWALAAWFTPRMGKGRWLWAIPLVGGLVWLVVAGRVLGDWQMDDAYISYRYAWNFVHGQGLVYNPGEIVEGYTNFLWTLISSAVLWLKLPPAGPMLAANIGLAMGVTALSWRLAKQLTGSYMWANVAVLLLCVDGAMAAYGARGSGMEAMLFGFFVLLGLTFLWNDASKRTVLWRAFGGIALALGALTRPEGLLVAGILVAVRLAQDYAGRTGKGVAWGKGSVASVAAFLAIVVPYEAWRVLFYGWPFPNTFYAKTGTTVSLVERGMIYTGYFVTERWFVVAMAAVGAILLLGGRKVARSGMVAAIVVLMMAWTGYVLWAGGDYFPGWRFYVPVLAPLVLVCVWATHRLVSWFAEMGSRVGMAAVAIVVAVLPLYCWRALWQQEANGSLAAYTKIHTSYVDLWGSAGLWLRDNTPADSVTAAEGAGAIAYFSQRRVIDMLGLNDLHIGHTPVGNMGEGKAGHEKRDPAYVLSQKPDYVYALWADYFESVKEQFEGGYESALYRSPTGTKIEWMVRKDSK